MKKLTDINTDFAQWYQEVIFNAELVDVSPTRGSMVIRPYGYAIWENFQKILDKKIKEQGAQNAYFPLLIPESFFKKEAEHVEGFAPEVAVVTHAGGKKLEEPYVIRPTSETIIYYMFSRWIKSWRDLPLKINQWANVVRWEMRPRAFLRTTEFLWQEGHTAHATHEEAVQMALDAREMYRDFMENYLSVPVFMGTKTKSEQFAGAERTYCLEAIMPDGKALQMGTTHVLAQSFPESFGIQFQNKDGKMQTPCCSSWGVSTRMVGGLLMMHGDSNGLVFPPRVAPIQVVIVPIYRKEEDKELVMGKVYDIASQLKALDIRVHIDDDETERPGAKFFRWELKGVPLRIEIGPRDVENNQVMCVNRAEPDKEKKKTVVAFDAIVQQVPTLLEQIQNQLFKNAHDRVEKQVQHADDLEVFSPTLAKENGVYQTGWCGSEACEQKLKEFKGSIRCIIDAHEHKKCFACDQESGADVIVSKSY